MTDAIKAGQSPAEKMMGIVEKGLQPAMLLYFCWPWFSQMIFGPPEEPETPPEPASWSWTFLKWGLYASFMATLFLLMIFTRQESMLYVPN